jgi:uncharacterized protein (UPF0276 family)
VAALDQLPLTTIAYVHMAGGLSKHGFYHDTHAHAVPEACFSLFGELLMRTGAVPVLLERDRHFQDRAAIDAELDALRELTALAPTRRLAARSPARVALGHTPNTTPLGVAGLGRAMPNPELHDMGLLQSQLTKHILDLDAPPPWPDIDPVAFRAAQQALAHKHLIEGMARANGSQRGLGV